MSKTLDRVRARASVLAVDDERAVGNSIFVTLKEDFFFNSDPGFGCRGFDTVREAEEGTRASELYEWRN